MTAIVSTLTSLPFTQLRRNRYFYLWYDGFYAVLCVALIALMRWAHHGPLIETWDNRYWILLPFAMHAQILCSVWIHNATHNNFPRAINRLVGEICGFVVLTRFASWEVIHQRHHRFSDDIEKDPHPVERSYWIFLWKMIINVEKQLQKTYFDLYGESTQTRRYEMLRAVVSFGTMVVVVTAWYTFLGFYAFWCFFFPAAIVGVLHLAHFNWSTHNGFSPRAEYRPINIDSGFYKIGNLIWHGIYMHANHHKRANMFNPAKMKDSLPLTVPGE